MDQKDYRFFVLREGNIADYVGDAIVVPCWTGFGTDAAISRSINHKLRNLGRPEMFENFPICETEPFSAHYFSDSQLPDVVGYIMACCYVLRRESAEPFDIKAMLTTQNALTVASQQGVKSIAFPIYLVGEQGGNPDLVLPAMANVFEEHARRGLLPDEVTLFAFGQGNYNNAMSILDSINK